VTRRLGQVPDALARHVLRIRVLQGRDELRDEPRRGVDPGDDRARNVAFLDLVLDAGEGQRELVRREATLAKFAYVPPNSPPASGRSAAASSESGSLAEPVVSMATY
jgi:hypothetical protein